MRTIRWIMNLWIYSPIKSFLNRSNFQISLSIFFISLNKSLTGWAKTDCMELFALIYRYGQYVTRVFHQLWQVILFLIQEHYFINLIIISRFESAGLCLTFVYAVCDVICLRHMISRFFFETFTVGKSSLFWLHSLKEMF